MGQTEGIGPFYDGSRFLTFVRNDNEPVISTEGRNLLEKLRPRIGLERQDIKTIRLHDAAYLK